jgi:phosphoribosylformylglycinamidine synthase
MKGRKQMGARIEVAMKSDLPDPRGNRFRKRIEEDHGLRVASVRILDVYHVDKALTGEQLEACRQGLFTDPLTQHSSLGPLPGKAFDWMIEIGFLPGVTDNVGSTSREAIEDLLGIRFEPGESVYSAEQILLRGALAEDEVRRIASIRYNPLIQRAWIQSRAEWEKDPMDRRIYVPRVQLAPSRRVDTVSLNVDDEELARLGREGILERGHDGRAAERRGPLALDMATLKVIRDHFNRLGRDPTDIELESIAQTWSEHCKHTIFAARIDEVDSLYKTYIQGATREIRAHLGKDDWCLSVFRDNSGVIRLNRDWSICYKVETHNSPSALDPYGGAITGIVGVNRDPLGTGMGARLIVNTYGFCFGDPTYRGSPYYRLPGRREPTLHPKVIFEGVREGVEHGGNKSGIPTAWGFLTFDERYMGKPLVFVGTVGLLPATLHGRPSHCKGARPGDRIVMAGGRVGKDGIHGATFSSEAMHAGSPATAVQIGDPITQKKLADAQIEIRDLGLYHSVTDNGAGGLSCSVAEMARECGGCRIILDQVPIKYEGLLPYEIWISESQERMTYAVPPENADRFQDLMRRRGVEATVIGEFTDDGRCVVEFEGRPILDLDMDFLHNGNPQKVLRSAYTERALPEPEFPEPQDMAAALRKMLGRLNLCSKEYVVRQFDHEVQAGSVVKPLVGKLQDVASDAAVVRPLLERPEGIGLSHSLYPSYGDIDPYWMAACAIDTAIRNLVAVGAPTERIALLDNFCWSSSDEPERLGQLKRAARACYDFAVAYGTPFISGKDSMYNDFKGFDELDRPVKISVPPTLLISSLGFLEDVSRSVTLDAKTPGDRLYLLGTTRDELGASEYYAFLGETLTGRRFIGNRVPQVDAGRNAGTYRALHQAIRRGLVSASASLGLGGLATAASKMALGGDLGVEIDLAAVITEPGDLRTDRILYSESQGRILATVRPENEGAFLALFAGVPCSRAGRVTEEPFLRVRDRNGRVCIDEGLTSLREAYKKTLWW